VHCMKTNVANILTIIFFGLSISSCNDSDKILVGKNFKKGDWFFVNVNYVEQTIQIIDNENILEEIKNDIYVKPSGECKWTTCDGFLKLYKDGELIEMHEYLSRSEIYETEKIKSFYKLANEATIDPINKDDFKIKWDSLKRIANTYPTRYHTQPADKDIIWLYQYTRDE